MERNKHECSVPRITPILRRTRPTIGVLISSCGASIHAPSVIKATAGCEAEGRKEEDSTWKKWWISGIFGISRVLPGYEQWRQWQWRFNSGLNHCDDNVACTYFLNVKFGQLEIVPDYVTDLFTDIHCHHCHRLPDRNPNDCGMSTIFRWLYIPKMGTWIKRLISLVPSPSQPESKVWSSRSYLMPQLTKTVQRSVEEGPGPPRTSQDVYLPLSQHYS